MKKRFVLYAALVVVGLCVAAAYRSELAEWEKHTANRPPTPDGPLGRPRYIIDSQRGGEAIPVYGEELTPR